MPPKHCFWCEGSCCPEHPFPPTQLLRCKLPRAPFPARTAAGVQNAQQSFPQQQLLGSRMPSIVSRQDSCGVQDALGSLSRQSSKLLSTGSPVQLQFNQQLPQQNHFADVGGKGGGGALHRLSRYGNHAACSTCKPQDSVTNGLPVFAQLQPCHHADCT